MEEPRFQTPIDEVFATPSASAPPPPPPPPPPRRAESQEMVRLGRRFRSPTRGLLRTPGGARVPQGEPPLELQMVEKGDQGWEPQWENEDYHRWGYDGWNPKADWTRWDDWKPWEKGNEKWPEQVESGKLSCRAPANHHSPLTLGDWLALVGPLSRKRRMEQAKQLCERWLRSTPLERLQITVDIPERLKTPQGNQFQHDNRGRGWTQKQMRSGIGR